MSSGSVMDTEGDGMALGNKAANEKGGMHVLAVGWAVEHGAGSPKHTH